MIILLIIESLVYNTFISSEFLRQNFMWKEIINAL